MKNCGRCKELKDLKSFSKDNRTNDGLCWMCKLCKSSTMKELRERSEEFRNKANQRAKELNLKLQKLVFEFLLEHPCIDCGLKDPRCLEFDHVFAEKEGLVSKAKAAGATLKMKAEMEKCEVRCGNCHRKKSGIDYPSFKDKAHEKM